MTATLDSMIAEGSPRRHMSLSTVGTHEALDGSRSIRPSSCEVWSDCDTDGLDMAMLAANPVIGSTVELGDADNRFEVQAALGGVVFRWFSAPERVHSMDIDHPLPFNRGVAYVAGHMALDHETSSKVVAVYWAGTARRVEDPVNVRRIFRRWTDEIGLFQADELAGYELDKPNAPGHKVYQAVVASISVSDATVEGPERPRYTVFSLPGEARVCQMPSDSTIHAQGGRYLHRHHPLRQVVELALPT